MKILAALLLILAALFSAQLSPSPLPSPTSTDQQQDTDLIAQFSPQSTTGSYRGRIAFTAKLESGERIFIYDLRRKKITPLAVSKGNDHYPSFSPDGNKLVFTSDRNGNRDIFVTDLRTNALIQITKTPKRDEDHASFHPTEEKVVFYRSNKKKGSELFTIDLLTGTETRLTQLGKRNSTPRFSPQGSLVAFSTDRFWPGWDVCLWDIDTSSEKCVLKGVKSYCRPEWSRSGRMIAYSQGIGNNVDLAVLNLKNNSSQTLISLPGKQYDPVWSKNDKFIAFASEDSSGRFQLFVVDVVSGEHEMLLSAPYSMRYLSWGANPKKAQQKTTPAQEANE